MSSPHLLLQWVFESLQGIAEWWSWCKIKLFLPEKKRDVNVHHLYIYMFVVFFERFKVESCDGLLPTKNIEPNQAIDKHMRHVYKENQLDHGV